MTSHDWVMLVSAIFLAGSLVWLGFCVRKTVTMNVTVQPPVAILPPQVEAILNEVNEKLHPPQTTATAAILDGLIQEAILLADEASRKAAHPLKGVEKFRIARDMVLKRAAEQNLEVQPRAVALAIDGAVLMLREKNKALAHAEKALAIKKT